MPTVIAASPSVDSVGEGYVLPSFDRGALLLKDQEGTAWRLTWEADDAAQEEGADRRRALPAGKYALVGYRILRDSKDGEAWHLSATGQNIAQIQVTAKEVARMDVPSSVTMTSRLKGRNVGMGITGWNGAGLSIYKAGHRIAIDYQLTGLAGIPLAKGPMNYG